MHSAAADVHPAPPTQQGAGGGGRHPAECYGEEVVSGYSSSEHVSHDPYEPYDPSHHHRQHQQHMHHHYQHHHQHHHHAHHHHQQHHHHAHHHHAHHQAHHNQEHQGHPQPSDQQYPQTTYGQSPQSGYDQRRQHHPRYEQQQHHAHHYHHVHQHEPHYGAHAGHQWQRESTQEHSALSSPYELSGSAPSFHTTSSYEGAAEWRMEALTGESGPSAADQQAADELWQQSVASQQKSTPPVRPLQRQSQQQAADELWQQRVCLQQTTAPGPRLQQQQTVTYDRANIIVCSAVPSDWVAQQQQGRGSGSWGGGVAVPLQARSVNQENVQDQKAKQKAVMTRQRSGKDWGHQQKGDWPARERSLPHSFGADDFGRRERSSGSYPRPGGRSVCRHYVAGTCYYGDDCRFSHDVDSAPPQQNRDASEDHVRPLRERLSGTCASWDQQKCFGFIEADTGERGFVHAAFLQNDPAMQGVPPGEWKCVPGQRYTFTLVPNDRDPSKWSAIDVQAVSAPMPVELLPVSGLSSQVAVLPRAVGQVMATR